MTFTQSVVFAILITIDYGLEGFLTIYLVDGIYKYQVKHKRVIYPVILVFGMLFTCTYMVTHILKNDPADDLGVVETLLLQCIEVAVLIIFTNTKWWKKLIIAVCSVLTSSAVGDVFVVIRSQTSRTLGWEDHPELTGIFVALSLSLSVLLIGFFHIIRRLRNKQDNTPVPIKIVILTPVIMHVFIILSAFVFEFYYSDRMQGLILVITMIFLLALLLLFFNSWVSFRERNSLKSMNSINEELISSQARFFESTAKADHEIRAMRHDMKNNIQVLMLLLEQGEYDKMREYLEEMGEKLSGTEVNAHTGDMIADAIIADKKVLANSKNINLKYSGRIEGVNITPVDMCKILANLLDNAIEAVSKPELAELDDSLKVIEIQYKKTENFFMISVTNPCIKAPQIKDGKIVTSKKDSKNHGFGLQNIENAAQSYGGEFNVSCEEKPYGFLFRSEVVFPMDQ